MSLQDNVTRRCLVGVVKGFLVMLGVKKCVSTEGKATLGLYAGWSAGSLPKVEEKGHGELAAPLRMRINFAGGDVPKCTFTRTSYLEDTGYGANDALNTSWEDVVKEDSDWFSPQGLKFKLKVSIDSD